MNGLRKNDSFRFGFIDKILVSSKTLYSSFDQNIYIMEHFRFVSISISKIFDIESFIIVDGSHFGSNFCHIYATEYFQIFPRNAGHNWCSTDSQNERKAKGCRAWGMHDRRGAGHEEYMTGGVQDMSVRKVGCRHRIIIDRMEKHGSLFVFISK